MYLKTAMQIALVFFATVGVWCAMRGLLDKLTGAKEHTVAIEILTQRDAESAEVLIRDALCRYFLLSSGRAVVITTKELLNINKELRNTAKRYGVTLYTVDK